MAVAPTCRKPLARLALAGLIAFLVPGAARAAFEGPYPAPPPSVEIPLNPLLSPLIFPPEAPSPTVPPPFTPTLKQEIAAVGKAVDTTHEYLEQNFLSRVVWFDNFFGTANTEHRQQTEYSLRWQNELRWEAGGRYKYRTSVRANLRLAKISDRLHLLVVGESETEPSVGLPQDPGNPGFDRTIQQNTRLVNTELRYSLIRRPDVDLFFGAGARVVLPPEAFTRVRLQYDRQLGKIAAARFVETGFWKDTLGFGETTEVSLSRHLRPKLILGWGNSGTLAQRSSGLEWGSVLSLLREISPNSAISLSGGVFGATVPATVIRNYKVSSRYRRNFLRDWFFFEVEPEVTWPRGDPGGGYRRDFALTLRGEVVFQGKSRGDNAPVASPPASR